MRTAAAAVALILLAAAQAWADEPVEPAEIAAAARPLRDAWDRCLAKAVKPRLEGDEPAGIIADEALDRCKPRETALRTLLARRVGPVRAGRILSEARDEIRAGLISTIETLKPE
jgi:hypothetical protein